MDFVSVYLRLILSCFMGKILAHIVAKYIRSWSDYACINSLVVREFQVQRINTRSFISLLEELIATKVAGKQYLISIKINSKIQKK